MAIQATTAIKMPITAQSTDNPHENIVTVLKLLNNCKADTVGNIIRAEISSDPTRFIASTMIMAINIDMIIL